MESLATTANPSLLRSAWRWWKDTAACKGTISASRMSGAALWEFLRDSMPARRRQLYGDVDFDWAHRVNTTSAAVGWRERLLGVFHSAYQPTEAGLFHEMMDALQQQARNEHSSSDLGGSGLPDRASRGLVFNAPGFNDFTFVDLGSGKGRALLMAADYPFRRIVGVELLPTLHQIAQENLRKYRSETQTCFALELVCGDAGDFQFPDESMVLYMFNPFPESGLRRVLANLEQSLRDHPRRVYVLYHNPLLEHALRDCAVLRKIGGTHQYSLYVAGLSSR